MGKVIYKAMFVAIIMLMMFVVYLNANNLIFMALYGVPAIGIGIYSLFIVMKGEDKEDEDFYVTCMMLPVANACIFYAVIIMYIILKIKERS